MTRGSKIKLSLILIASGCVIMLLIVLSPTPKEERIFDDIVPLAAGEYEVQGIADFTGADVDISVSDGIIVKADFSFTNHGLVKIDVICPREESFYISLLRDDDENGVQRSEGYYDKKLKPYGSSGVFSLTQGSGEYELCVWLKKNRVDETRSNYRMVYRKCFTADFPEEAPYMYSNANSVFEKDSLAAAYANALTRDADTDMKKAQAIIAFVHDRVSYDSDISLDEEVFMTADEILSGGKGLCYHSAGLAVSMLKSVGIPAKEVRGTYVLLIGRHAWCEVFINNEWLTADPTCYSTFPLNSFLYRADEFSNPYN